MGSAQVVSGEGVSTGAAHPWPQYTKADDAKLEAGLQCYYPGCKSTFHSYGSLLTHVTNVRGLHKRPMKQLKGSHLHTQGCKDINAKQNERNKKKREAPPDATVADGPNTISSAEACPVQQATKMLKVKQEAAEPHGESVGAAKECDIKALDTEGSLGTGPAGAGHMAGGLSSGSQLAASVTPQLSPHQPCHVWQAMRCWVKCHPDGTPCEPLEVNGLAKTSDLAKKVPRQQGALLQYIQPGMSPELLSGPCGQLATQPSAGGDVVPAPMDMLTDVWRHQKLQQAKEEKDRAWQQGLPEVLVKPSYLNHAGVPAKGDIVDGKPWKRAEWPPGFSSDYVQVDAFQKWLVTDKKYQPNWAKERCKDVGRFLGALDCSDNKPLSTECMVAVGLGDTYKQLFAMPLMAAKYA